MLNMVKAQSLFIATAVDKLLVAHDGGVTSERALSAEYERISGEWNGGMFKGIPMVQRCVFSALRHVLVRGKKQS